jgi:hypothetical protein
MTKLIAVFLVLVALFGGYRLYLYWGTFKNEDTTGKPEAVAVVLQPESLSGLPQQLESSLKAAQQQGPAAFRNWLKTYDRMIHDPRKAWIELDYCVAITRDNPAEARSMFASVKARTPPSSPVWPRIKELEKSYE